ALTPVVMNVSAPEIVSWYLILSVLSSKLHKYHMEKKRVKGARMLLHETILQDPCSTALHLCAGMPTCLLCVCMGGSVYCDDTSLEQIPPLPKDTTHFYGRFNKIQHVKNTDFINLSKTELKTIDLTGNQISEMDEDAFRLLPQLQELLLADNNLQALPELPNTMRHIDARNNRLLSSGVHPEGFKVKTIQLEFLYLSNNKLDYIPTPLPESLRALHLQNNNIQHLHEGTFCNRHNRNYIRRNLEDIRLDGNPLDINLFAQAYICLQRLPRYKQER
uniref:Opticin n=1 Tax=Myripristis murdjan TaxID=586833 RepID=A0A667YYV2_9TELE